MIDRRHWLMHLGALGALGGSAPADARASAHGAPMVRPGQPLRFPRDFGAHPEFRTEWWYITGQLGRDLGFQITFFRSRVDTAQGNPSRLAARQLILAHAALTDVRAGQLLHEQRVAREGLGLAGAALDDTHAHLRSWSLQRSGTATQSLYQARIEAQEFRLLLDLRATQALLLQGDAGYSRKGPLPTQASHYYSQPQLAVTGQLTLRGQSRPVTGRAWMDHEWSESLLAPDAVGWDWIGMNLHDGTALTAFQVRRADGSIRWVGGSWRAAGQAARPFGPDELRFTPGRRWRSPATQAAYPVAWRIDTPVGRFTVRARLDAQELAGQQSTGTVYWEGLCDLIDAQQRVIGTGYLEMTGYASPLML